MSSSSSALVWWSGDGEDYGDGFRFSGWSMKARKLMAWLRNVWKGMEKGKEAAGVEKWVWGWGY